MYSHEKSKKVIMEKINDFPGFAWFQNQKLNFSLSQVIKLITPL